MRENNNKIWDVIIIGGGASGMMAGAVASSQGKSVLILDKNRDLGEKLKITGGGRCNITNNEPDIHKLLSVYGEGAPFLYTPFSIFGVKDTFKYFESRGLPLVVQARNRVFPATEKAIDVYNVLRKDLNKNNVSIKNNCTVKKINTEFDLIKSVETDSGVYFAHSFILATGGMSHPETGSTGDGFKWLKDMGHEVKDSSPNIVPLAVSDEWVKSLAGVSLSFMKITFYLEGKKQFSKTGKILFTHFGLSGPLILNSSKKVDDLLQQDGLVTASIDAYPDTNEGKLEESIIKTFDANKNKIFRTILKDIVPEGMSKSVELMGSGIDFDTKVHSISKETRKKMVKLLKSMSVTITNLMGYERSVVADGGISLKEIDMKTMSSKIYKNLRITGDLLNISRNSGGYSLQICWTTGYIAGNSI
ncbi:MAG: aminoacetone oxidase family FAD-binding enzyme [Candidatus Nomurabacteria bacterium]